MKAKILVEHEIQYDGKYCHGKDMCEYRDHQLDPWWCNLFRVERKDSKDGRSLRCAKCLKATKEGKK